MSPTSPTIPEGITREAWQRAQAQALAKAELAMPEATRRLAFAANLVEAGAVEHRGQFGRFDYVVHNPDGSASSVQSIAPMTCTCEEMHIHGTEKGYVCTHLLAVRLYTRALALVERENPPVPPAPAAVDDWPSEETLAHEATPLPAPVLTCPEAVFSLCLRGTMRGLDAQLTVRGQCNTEFLANVASVQALLDVAGARPQDTNQAPPAGAPTPEGWCLKHGLQMTLQQGKDGSQWWSHRRPDGWCKGK